MGVSCASAHSGPEAVLCPSSPSTCRLFFFPNCDGGCAQSALATAVAPCFCEHSLTVRACVIVWRSLVHHLHPVRCDKVEPCTCSCRSQAVPSRAGKHSSYREYTGLRSNGYLPGHAPRPDGEPRGSGRCWVKVFSCWRARCSLAGHRPSAVPSLPTQHSPLRPPGLRLSACCTTARWTGAALILCMGVGGVPCCSIQPVLPAPGSSAPLCSSLRPWVPVSQRSGTLLSPLCPNAVPPAALGTQGTSCSASPSLREDGCSAHPAQRRLLPLAPCRELMRLPRLQSSIVSSLDGGAGLAHRRSRWALGEPDLSFWQRQVLTSALWLGELEPRWLGVSQPAA